jgi:hypothetical protein
MVKCIHLSSRKSEITIFFGLFHPILLLIVRTISTISTVSTYYYANSMLIVRTICMLIKYYKHTKCILSASRGLKCKRPQNNVLNKFTFS